MSENSIIAVIGKNISTQRRLLGISQKDLAQRLDITPDALVRIEKGRMAPKMTRLQDIARLLNCSVSFLVRDDADMPTEHAIQIANLLEPLPLEGQEALLALIATTCKIMQNKL